MSYLRRFSSDVPDFVSLMSRYTQKR